jgi:hypothetical protein
MRVARRAKPRTSLPAQGRDRGRSRNGNGNQSALPGASRKSNGALPRTQERRAYARARMELSLSVRRVAGQPSDRPIALHTVDISPSGAFFLYPHRIDPGTPLLIEVALLEQRRRHSAVRMSTDAHVVRAQPSGRPGWHGLAVAFDDIRYLRGEHSLAHSGTSVAAPPS